MYQLFLVNVTLLIMFPQKEKYHTHLTVLYLEAVIKLLEASDVKKEELDVARSKLRHMLQMSDLYRVQLILGKAKEKNMHAECAILYGKVKIFFFFLN